MKNHYSISSFLNEKVIRLQRLQRVFLYWTAWGFVLLFVASCANSANTSDTPTPQQTATQSDQIELTPALSAIPTAPAIATFSAQQVESTLQENGKTLTVPITSRVWLAFDQRQYPKQNIQISCHPAQAIDSHSLQGGGLLPPFYLVGYQAVEKGMCTIKNGSFLLTVKVV